MEDERNPRRPDGPRRDTAPGEDRALGELRQALREAAAEDRPEAGAEARADADDELLGLLAYGLDERPPAPHVKEWLMAAVRSGGDTAGGAAHATAAAADSVPLADPRRAPAPSPPGGGPLSRPWLSARPWLPALAAALFLAVVGLAFFTGKQVGELGEQRRTIADLSERLAAADARAADLAASRSDLASRLALVATPGVEVCPLRPRAADAPYPEARGLLFLSGPRQEWYVRVAELEPAPDGQTYRLWFVFGDEPRQAGILLPGQDDAVVLAGRAIPSDREMTAALVTLEPLDLEGDRPSGPTILYGDERMDIL